jgi:hypothetical protein
LYRFAEASYGPQDLIALSSLSLLPFTLLYFSLFRATRDQFFFSKSDQCAIVQTSRSCRVRPDNLQTKPWQSFFLEVGWLITPTQRQRLIRRYNAQGGWESLTLVTETKL